MAQDVATRVAQAIARLGPHFNDEILKATYDLYVPLQREAPKEGIRVERDIAYGEDERHRLDVFQPQARSTKAAPIVVFFHGGGYIAGARSPVPGLIYDNVPTFFARHGFIGVNATYRLAPMHRWPSGGEDVGRVVAWLRVHGERFGGDPDRIFLVGHSAGATHAATWSFIERVHGPAGPRVAGVMLISGVYAALHPSFSNDPPRQNQFDYYGPDPEAWWQMAPFVHVKPDHPPVFIATSQFEPYYYSWPSVALLEALVKVDRRMPRFRFLPGHNHASSALQINCAIDTLGPDLLAFVESVTSSRSLT